MGKTSYMKLKGILQFQQRLLLATLSTNAILIEEGTKLRNKPEVWSEGSIWCMTAASVVSSGITNDSKDPSVDSFRATTLHMLKRFGIPLYGLELKIVSRGAPPLGSGEIILGVPIVQTP